MFRDISICLILIIIVQSISTGLDGCKKKMVIDNDGGADDAEAIIIAILYEKYFDGPCLVALTATYGNVDLSQAILNNERILNLSNRTDIPIYTGAEVPLITGRNPDHYFGFDGLGDNNYTRGIPLEVENEIAAVALIELSKKFEDDLIVIAIGPVTNIALAIRLDPGFIDRITHLYLGGGHFQSMTFPKAEFNVAVDPEAYYIVADAANIDKTTLVPFSQVLDMVIDKEWRINVLGAINTPTVEALNSYERVSLAVNESWSLLDPAVVGIALDSGITEEYRTVKWSVGLNDDRRGITEFDFTSPKPNTRVFYRGNVDTYKKFLIDVYSAELEDELN